MNRRVCRAFELETLELATGERFGPHRCVGQARGRKSF
jgi:hypothetical protein